MAEQIRVFDNDVYIQLEKYSNNNSLAILLVDNENEYFGDLTVNLPVENNMPINSWQEVYGKNIAYVDINNFPGVEELINTYKLGEFTGTYGESGYCIYPLYKFNINNLKKYTLDN